jgi:hypothetical protein
MDEVVVHHDFEDPAPRGKDGEFGDLKFELF